MADSWNKWVASLPDPYEGTEALQCECDVEEHEDEESGEFYPSFWLEEHCPQHGDPEVIAKDMEDDRAERNAQEDKESGYDRHDW
jgi:hypothetical protein